MSKAEQLELGFSKPAPRVQVHVRFGRVPDIVTLHDIDNMIGPHGEAAQDAVERDLAMTDCDGDFDEWGE